MTTSSTSGRAHQHVPALDGIRGLAVAAVLLYHLDSAPLAGGFLGVSSFFTLSGFLITTPLLREREASRGSIDLGAFWGRRWRRLLPALLCCLALTVVGATLGAFGPAQVDAVRGAVPWALGYAANWHQLTDGGGYLADLAAPSPLEHLWSLGIEEQFYVLFPLVIAGAVARWARSGSRGLLAGLLVAGAAASWSLSALAGWSAERVYLGTDTRLVELLAGALLAAAVGDRLGGAPGASSWSRVARVIAPFALASQVVMWLTVDDSSGWLFRGGFGAYATLSCLVILGALVPGPLAAALRWRPLAAVGVVSYGVYLYHWPVYLWLTPDRVGFGGAGLAVVRFAVTGALAVVSYRLIEDPIRRTRARRVLRPALTGAMASTLVVAGLLLPRPPTVEIAGIGPNGGVQPEPVPARSASPWRVLLVVDEQSAGIVADLAGLATPTAGWEIAGVVRLDCGASAGPCSWERDWVAPSSPDRVDASVVLTDAWDYRDELGLTLPSAPHNSEEAVEWAAARFVAGIDLLSGRAPRPVLWVDWPVDAAGGLTADLAGVEWSVERRITAARPSLIHVELAEPAPGAIADAISVQALAAAGEDSAVMVVGDSVASSMAVGLTAWGRTHDVVVWSNARGGCGVIQEGQRVALDGSLAGEGDCRAWRQSWAEAAHHWHADLVVVLVGVWDVSDRRLPGGEAVRAPGDPAWDRFVLEQYGSVLDELGRVGIPVVLMTPPCMGYEGARVPGGLGGGHAVFALDRQRYFSENVLPRLIDAHPDARLYDLFADLCPNGGFEELVVDGELVRPDGVHFGDAGTMWWAEHYAAELVGAGA